MAVEIGELRARMTAEAQGLKAEIKAVKNEIAGLGDQGKKTATDIKSMDTAFSKIGSSKDQITRLTAELDNTNAKIDLQRKKLSELKESYDNTFNEQRKNKLQEQILSTEAALLKLTQKSDQTAQKIWDLEDQAQKAGDGLEGLNQVLKEIGLSSGQIDKINKAIQSTNPELLEEQLEQVREQLRMIGLDAKHIDKIEQELKETTREAKETQRGLDGLATGLTSLGTGMTTMKLAQTMKVLSDEAHKLAQSYQGLTEVSKSLNLDTEQSIGLAEELSDRWGLSRTAMADTVKTYLTAGLTLEQTKEIMTATADAAVYNREAHLTWDEAIRQVAQGIKMGNSDLTDAAGITTNLSVMYDRYAKSIGTTAAKLTEAQKIQAAYNGIMQESAMFAGNADSAMTGYTGTQATFSQTVEMARVELGEAFLPILEQIMQKLTPMIKEFVTWAEANKEVVAGIAAGSVTVLGLVTVLGTLTVAIGAVTAALRAMNIAMGPIGWVVTILSVAAAGVGAYKMAADAAAESVLTFAQNQEELNKKLAESPANRTAEDLKKLQSDTETLNALLEERAKAQERLNEAQKAMPTDVAAGTRISIPPETIKEMNEARKALEEIDKQLRDMDFSNAEEAAEALKKMREQAEKSTPALLDMAKAEMQDVAAKNSKILEMEKTLKRYKELDAVQKVDEAQKQELVAITNTLKKQYPGLHALMDEEGRIRITNVDLVSQQIDIEKNLVSASVESAKAQISNLKETAAAQKAAVEAQIKNYQALARVMSSISGKALDIGMTEGKSSLTRVGGMLGGIVAAGVQAQANAAAAKMAEEQNKYANAELEAERALNNLTTGNLDAFAYKPPNYGGGGEADDDKKKKKKEKKSKEKEGKSAAELAKEQRQAAFDAAMATARYNAEFYDQTAEQQLKALKKIQANHKQHLKETIEDQRELNLQMKRLQEDSAKSNYEASATWIDRQERKMEESYKSEVQIAQMKVDTWTKVRDRYKKDSEFYKSADEELYRARKELAKAQYEASSEWISKEERRMQDSYKTEVQIAQMKVDSWTRVRDRYKKGSEEYKKADEELYRARKELWQAQFANSEEWIAKEERRMEEAGKTEKEIEQMKLAAWTRVRDRYNKNSEEYKRADEEVYRARKALMQDLKKETDDFFNAQKKSLDDSLRAELDAIEKRKKAYVDAQNEKIKAIDDLIAKEQELNVDEDYETELAKKLARQQELSTAVSPEGRKALADITEEIERMQLERSRELRKRDLEDQKQKLVDEKGEREKAFDDERQETEARYEALKNAFENHQNDVQFIENAIKDFRIGANESANQQILADLDQFVSEYNAKLSRMAEVSGQSKTSQAELDLQEYNANKDAWAAAKARGDTAEMARLTARNEELRKLYGINKDTGKLQTFKDGGVVQGRRGEAVPVIAHAGEMYLNPEQQNTLWKLVSGQAAAPMASKSDPVVMQTVNHIDMSIERVEVQDPTDAEILYTERERTYRRLAMTGGGK
ncbi:hypothetical protein [Paenibacillus lactis]|uniref:Phage tail tape measure protein n=1 Tax=Paenibacillus lactis TaxID=228574 RepID=A0ABS4FA99_9BACL|nr:hypothetical protein [Paenibacillus lactis]MBP1892982.1 hypothetical protein [Paenibacillus lactis]HAF97547.1 hypothetical protein [Paenibacillus lactis]